MPDKKVAILTNFSSYSPAYSLIRVVQNQIRMLVDHGYKPVVIVGKYFEPEEDFKDKNVILKRISDVPVYNEVKVDSTFDQDVLKLEKDISEALDGVDVVLTHDIIYQPSCMKHLIASKRVAVRHPEIRWLHWIHSATSPYTLGDLRPIFKDEYKNLIKEEFPNSFYISFNNSSRERIMVNFGLDGMGGPDKVKMVPHPTDIKAFYKIEDDSWKIIKKYNILSKDVISTYAIRLDTGKQLESVIKTIASFKKLNKSVCLIVGDFHSTGIEKVEYRNKCKEIAKEWGMDKNELIWLSEQKPQWEIEVPYAIISDFERLQNVFIMACRSESYSLITQEAALSGATLMVNKDFPPFREIFGWAPHQWNFGSNINATTLLDGETNPNVTDEITHYLNAASTLNFDLENDRSLVLRSNFRQFRNLDYVFEHFLEPLLYYEPRN